jgi:hypothetical protein
MYSIFSSPYLAQQRMRPASCAKIAGRRGSRRKEDRQLNQNRGAQQRESRGTVASGWRGSGGGQLEWRLILQTPAGNRMGTATIAAGRAPEKKTRRSGEEVFGVVTLRWSAGSVEGSVSTATKERDGQGGALRAGREILPLGPAAVEVQRW